jgi:hypothetical protein
MPTLDASSAAHIADTIIAAHDEHRDHVIRTPAQYRADLIDAATRAREASWDQYAAVCTVVDQAKNDDRSRDTDEYASEILAALAVTMPN